MAWEANGTGFPLRGGGSSSATRLSNNKYELDDELTRRHIECLEKKYGGRLRANLAATKIQRTFRAFQLQKQFKSAMNRDSVKNGSKQMEERGSSLQPYLKYQPTSSLRAQLFAARSAQTNISSPRKNSTPCMEPKLSGRSFNEAILSPRLSQRHGFVGPPTAQSTPTQLIVGGVLPSVWVPNNREKNITPILTNRASKNSMQVYNFDSPSSSLTPSESPAHGGKINCQNSTSSNSLESQNFVQIDSMLPVNGVRDASTPPSDNHQQNSTTSSSSMETAGTSHASRILLVNGYRVNNQQLISYNKSENPEQRRRRMYRVALNMFNKKPDRGIQMLIDWRFVDDHPTSIAKFILTRRGLSKKLIGEFLGTLRSDLHSAVLREVLTELEMKDLEIDEALRTMIYFFQLPTEAQKIDYIMQAFARRFHLCNEHRLPEGVTPDSIYVLSFAIIMLNTDLHSPSIKSTQRMTLNQFLKNTWGAFDTHVFDEQVLAGIYERIQKIEICPGNDHVSQVIKVDQTITGRDKPRLSDQHRRLICYCRVNEIASPNKKQSLSAHQREIFLFNDMILITKAVSNRKKDTAQYVLRQWTTLLGLKIEEFDGGELFPHAMQLIFPDQSTLLLNAKNANDRVRFIGDVTESICECQEMERVRISFELGRQAETKREYERALSAASSIEPETESGKAKFKANASMVDA